MNTEYQNNSAHRSASKVDPTTGTVLETAPYNSTSRKDQITTIAAMLLIGLGLWGTYSHRVDARLAPPSDSPGIAYNMPSLPSEGLAGASSGPAHLKASLAQLEERLAKLQDEAVKANQQPAYRLMSRRLERLQELLAQHFPDPSEATYVQRRLLEIDKDLGAFEQDVHSLAAQ